MQAETGSVCPGCGLELPADPIAPYDGYYNTSPECWSVYTEVLAHQYANVPVWGRAHQPVVDAYAVQHAGGPHPDKSVDIHLVGLHLALDRGVPATRVPTMLQHLASVIDWPHFPLPEKRPKMTVLAVALASDQVDHVDRALRWARAVWGAWAPRHDEIIEFAAAHLDF